MTEAIPDVQGFIEADALDDEQIAARESSLHGEFSGTFVHCIPDTRKPEGKACQAAIKNGRKDRIDCWECSGNCKYFSPSITLIYETRREYASVRVLPNGEPRDDIDPKKWVASAIATDLLTGDVAEGTGYGYKNNDFGYVQAKSKAARNAIKQIISQTYLQDVVALHTAIKLFPDDEAAIARLRHRAKETFLQAQNRRTLAADRAMHYAAIIQAHGGPQVALPGAPVPLLAEPTLAQEKERLAAARLSPDDALPPGEFPASDEPEPPTETEEVAPTCPDCGGAMVKRSNLRGGSWLACEAYCQRDSKQVPPSENDTCPQCNSVLKVRDGTNGLFIGCTAYPECKYGYNDVPDGLKKGDVFTRETKKPSRQEVIMQTLREKGLDFEVWFHWFLNIHGDHKELNRNTFWNTCKDATWWREHRDALLEGTLADEIRQYEKEHPMGKKNTEMPF